MVHSCVLWLWNLVEEKGLCFRLIGIVHCDTCFRCRDRLLLFMCTVWRARQSCVAFTNMCLGQYGKINCVLNEIGKHALYQADFAQIKV